MLKQTIGFEIGIFVQNNGKKRFVSKHRVSKHFRQHGHTVIQNMVFFLRDAKCMKLFCRVGFPNIDLHLCVCVCVHSNITKTNMYYIHGNLAMDMQCLSLYYIYIYIHIIYAYSMISVYIYIHIEVVQLASSNSSRTATPSLNLCSTVKIKSKRGNLG